MVTTMIATSINVLFPGHNHLLTTGTDDPTFWLSPKRQCLVASMVATAWIVAFLHSDTKPLSVVPPYVHVSYFTISLFTVFCLRACRNTYFSVDLFSLPGQQPCTACSDSIARTRTKPRSLYVQADLPHNYSTQYLNSAEPLRGLCANAALIGKKKGIAMVEWLRHLRWSNNMQYSMLLYLEDQRGLGSMLIMC